MAIQKNFELKDGSTSNYLTIKKIARLDYLTREAHIVFALFTQQSAKDAGKEPSKEAWLHLRIQADKFDRYFSKAALTAAAAAGKCINCQAYAAAKAETTDTELGSVDQLAGAVDV